MAIVMDQSYSNVANYRRQLINKIKNLFCLWYYYLLLVRLLGTVSLGTSVNSNNFTKIVVTENKINPISATSL